jgi:hypothetical protein
MDIYTAIVDQLIPVELTSFTARIADGKILLEWTTASEKNNLGFEILRSTDAENRQWATVGFISGKGSSTEAQHYSFSDEDLVGKVYYRLRQVDYNGTYNYSEIIEINAVSTYSIRLEQNYPNPFNPITTINYQLGNDGFVNLKVFNSLGEEVEELVNEFQIGGSYQFEFEAADLPSGIYVYKLSAGDYTESRKMIFLK